ncbi:MAG: nitronate monooxygenase [Actinobacteria bacterium]|nr:nitronate monooxygenase [Actinomycetota bacterium]
MTTAFTELVGCAVPLQLAGMGGIGADGALPVAVSRAGGLGMVGAAGMSPGALQDMLVSMSGETAEPFGVNFLVPFLDRDAVVVASKRCRVVEFFYGHPSASLIEIAHGGGALAAWQVGSGDEAAAAERAGCDFLIAQGTEAGGHVRGIQARSTVLTELLDAVSVPVLSAGGIGCAGDVVAAMEAGAAGVRVGTRFVAATESIAHPEYVAALVAARAGDTVLTETFNLGWSAPHRVLRSAVKEAEASTADSVGTIEARGRRWPVPRFSTMPPTKDMNGNIAAMALYAGTSASEVMPRQDAAEIVAELCREL